MSVLVFSFSWCIFKTSLLSLCFGRAVLPAGRLCIAEQHQVAAVSLGAVTKLVLQYKNKKNKSFTAL